MGFFGAIARHFDTFAGPVVMLLYPLYCSVRAIESPTELDDQQWLTYWVLYSLITLFELSFYKVLAWLPIWPYLKLIVSFWLVLPMFNGAAYIYENYVRKFVGKYRPNSDLPRGQKQVLRKISPDARAGVERYIAQHGPDAFEKIIKAAENEAKRQKGSQTGAAHSRY
jgi:receptor expression-enhancing protein 5/6